MVRFSNKKILWCTVNHDDVFLGFRPSGDSSTEIVQFDKTGFICKTLQTAFETVNAYSDGDNIYLLLADNEYVRIHLNEF